jgi:chromosome segregation ATPase
MQFTRFSREVHKHEEAVKKYLEDVEEVEAEKTEIETKINECDEKENSRTNNLQVARQQLVNALDERDALPDQLEGVDPDAEKALTVC